MTQYEHKQSHHAILDHIVEQRKAIPEEMEFFRVLAEINRLLMDDIETTGTHENTVFTVLLAIWILNARTGGLAVFRSELPVRVQLPQVYYFGSHFI